jgi:LPXTG-motif cell wall-anchored protein
VNKKLIAAAVLAAPVLSIAGAGAASATNVDYFYLCKKVGDGGKWAKFYMNGGSDVVKYHSTTNEDCTLKGDKGDKGEPGTSVKGDTGEQGPQGPQGPQGSTGAAGATGSTGSDGAAGATGPVGPKGPAGADGEDGKNGKNGTNKTVIVHADGSEETVDGLPSTGGDSTNTWAMAGAAGILLAVGTGTVVAVRRRRS